MKKSEIKVGSHYVAKVSGKLVTVRVDTIRERQGFKREETVYDVTNLATGRKTTFRSAAKFRAYAKKDGPVGKAAPSRLGTGYYSEAQEKQIAEVVEKEAEQRSDPPHCGSGSGTSPVSVTCPRCGASVAVTNGCYDYHRKSSGITCGMSGEKEPKEVAYNRAAASTVAHDKRQEGEQSADPTQQPRNGTTSDSTTNRPSVAGLLSKLAAPPSDGNVAGYTPTAEQAAILDAARQPGLEVLVICAGAGTGKTSTLKMLETVLVGRGQYTAFNTSLVAESKTKFQKARCNTTHSLAFGAVGKLYAHRLNNNRVYSSEVAAALGMSDVEIAIPSSLEKNEDGTPKVNSKTLKSGYLASQVTKALAKFCQSADREITARHFQLMNGVDLPGRYDNQKSVVEGMLPFARKAWTDYSDPNGTLPISKSMVHDVYVKVWQLGEGDKAPVIPADYILLDEAQDTAPVFLDVLRRQSALIVLVGDDNQQIYEWRGAVNAMASFPGAPRKLLSQSFRFGQTIADVANSILATLDEPTDLVMKGHMIPSRVIAHDDHAEWHGSPLGQTACRAVLCRTNACAVGTVLLAVKGGKRPHLIGGGAETVSFVKAALDLQQGRGTSHPELCLFKSWTEVQAYVKEDEGSDLKLMVKLIDEFQCRPILDALENMPKEEDADLVVSTAHKSKGREWTSVKLAGDFLPANRMGDPDRRLLYVAATRAQHVLDISECPPFLPSKDRDTGKDVPPIRITFTVPMPTVRDLETWVVEKTGGIPIASAPVTPAPKVVEVPNPLTFPKTLPEPMFTWSKWVDQWCLRGPKGLKPGTRVKVQKKNGQQSEETVGAVVKEFADATLYAVGQM